MLVSLGTHPGSIFENTDVHLDSKRVLPKFYNSKFDRRDRKSRELLQDLLEVSPTKGKRR